jgi:MFS family permease
MKTLPQLIVGQIFLHACMAGMRMATPLLALKQGYSPLAVGALLALFALTQVFLALPAGRYIDRTGLKKPLAHQRGHLVCGGQFVGHSGRFSRSCA